MTPFRVFKYDYAWSHALVLFTMDSSFGAIKKNISFERITKEDFIGIYEFDANFLELFDYNEEGDIKYYRRHLFDKDSKSDFFKKQEDELF